MQVKLLNLCVVAAWVFSQFNAQLQVAVSEDRPFIPVPRIVGGVEASPGEFPFLVAVINRNEGSLFDRQFCGASLIRPTWVLTAAHCTEGQVAEGLAVALGVHNLSEDSGEVINVKRIVQHPEYNSDTVTHDLALLELVTAASYPAIDMVEEDIGQLTGEMVTVAGWGLTIPGDDYSASDVVRKVSLPVVSNTTCNNAYGEGIDETMLCAGYSQGGKDSCQGDSGGPLIIRSGDEWIQAGIVSWGADCAAPGYYGVYSRLSVLRSFVDSTIGDDGGGGGGGTSEGQTTYGLWNGYLGMVNIVELVNRTDSKQQAEISLYKADGSLGEVKKVSIAAGQQLDLIVNSMEGFSQDSVGIVKLVSNLASRIFYYRALDVTFTSFDYAFGLDLDAPLTGNSYVSFNTYQPSLKAEEGTNTVANWLSLVNLSSSKKYFTVNKYDASGLVLHSESVKVPAFGRVDLDGGHVLPGANKVGLLEVIPKDLSSPYLSQLVRYGYNAEGGFDFAFTLKSSKGSSDNLSVPAGNIIAGQNWVEVVNTSSVTTQAIVKYYDGSGGEPVTRTVKIKGRAQTHLNATEFLGDGKKGHVEVDSQSDSRLLVQSMMYIYREDKGIAAMYGIQGTRGFSRVVRGSYNLYLGMENYLSLTNLSEEQQDFRILVTGSAISGADTTITLAAKQTVIQPLHHEQTWGTASNTYGVVTIEPASGANGIAHIVRAKPDDSGNVVEFAAPTGVN